MTANTARQVRGHNSHTVVVIHALRQRAGVPYEVERTVCTDCRRVLDERQLRRAAA
jgi:NMD protein affecting ribosome stability and mRNA decay